MQKLPRRRMQKGPSPAPPPEDRHFCRGKALGCMPVGPRCILRTPAGHKEENMDGHYFPFCTSLPHPALFKPATLRTPSSTAFSVLFHYQEKVSLSNFTSQINLGPSSSRSRSPSPKGCASLPTWARDRVCYLPCPLTSVTTLENAPLRGSFPTPVRQRPHLWHS